MSTDRRVFGFLVLSFNWMISCNDRERAVQEAIREYGESLGMKLYFPDERLIDVEQEPVRLFEWVCPHCEHDTNLSFPKGRLGYCENCRKAVNLEKMKEKEEAEREKDMGDFLAEVAYALRPGGPPPYWAMDGEHSDRLLSLARAFGWEGEEEPETEPG